jgi:hypothetical protein
LIDWLIDWLIVASVDIENAHGSWICNYLCKRCRSLRSWRWVIDPTLCDTVFQRLTTGQLSSPGIAVSSPDHQLSCNCRLIYCK